MNKNLFAKTPPMGWNSWDCYGAAVTEEILKKNADYPSTREFVWNKVKEHYYDKGIHTFWLDEAEPEVHPQQFSNLKFYIGNGAQTAMLYPYYYSKMFSDGLKKESNEPQILLTRAAYPGIQKFGALVWNGDIISTFESLEMSVKAGLSMAMSGIPWWNSDIGGFSHGDTESEYFRELIVRWMQFGVFSPVMRLHGAREHKKNQIDRHPEVKEKSGADNELWSFGEKNYKILTELVYLRKLLEPYILEQMEITKNTGKPIMRPMFFDYYTDEICYTLEDQYMFGDDILFAPITEQGQTSRKVYLPEGQWIDTKSMEIYNGRCWITCYAEIDEFIAFVKCDSPVILAFRDWRKRKNE